VIHDRIFALRAFPGDLVLEEFDLVATGPAFDVENGIKAPLFPVVSTAFSHDWVSYDRVFRPRKRFFDTILQP
jgi:hypothetical protein